MSKVKNKIWLLAFFTWSTTLGAQVYLTPVFDEIQIDTAIIYGMNANVFPTFSQQEAEPQLLVADIYKPKDDTTAARPIMLIIPGGNFLPHPMNASIARMNRKDSADVYLATRMAQMGYVAVIPDIRVGWNPVAADPEVRRSTALGAMMRQAQDVRTLIRFLKKSVAEDSNPYQINADKIALWGNDTGFYTAQLVAYLKDYQEFLLTPSFYTVDEDGVPTPMWLENIHGNIFGTSVGIDPTNGDTLSYPNHATYEEDVQLVVQLGRALLDTNLISANEAPLISFKAISGGLSPWFQENIVPMPSLFNEFGVGDIHTRVASLGLNNSFRSYEFTDPFTQERELQAAIYPDLFPMTFPELYALSQGFGLPWTFWNEENLNNQLGLMLSPNDALEAKLILDTMLAFVAPRACIALELDCDLSNFVVNTEEVYPALERSVKVYPNPATDEMIIAHLSGELIKEVHFYQLDGRLIHSYRQLGSDQIRLAIGAFPRGAYWIKVIDAKNVTSHKAFLH